MKKLLISAMFFLAFFQVATRAQDFDYQAIIPAF